MDKKSHTRTLTHTLRIEMWNEKTAKSSQTHHNNGLNLKFNASAHYTPLERDFLFRVRFLLKFPDLNINLVF